MGSTSLVHSQQLTLEVSQRGGVEKTAYSSDAIFATLQAKAQIDINEADVVYVDYGVIAPKYQDQPADQYDPNWDFSGVIEDVNALYAVGPHRQRDDISAVLSGCRIARCA